MQEILRRSSHMPTVFSSVFFPGSNCETFQGAQVVNVIPVQCATLRRKYLRTALELKEKHRGFLTKHTMPNELNLHTVDSRINEGFYLHGTDIGTAEKIERFGFDERCCRESALYGEGVYFTPDAGKALQYAKPDEHGLRTLIVARVLLGEPYYDKKARQGERRAPEIPSSTPDMCYDSVVARPGRMPGAPGDWQHHTEIVIFDGTQAYPAYIVRVRV
eukprot:gnl/TRDRNA2_/TRDRNA2_72867_c0_seq2.p1 gnl/TRDRNA2_/TRDRNA2_72867_c0~~gnl/TRDRNA2_/TRDRNA2_72867_c0_seq2.p1  ORF type:complete len:218 (-),score=16.31 gnl/TRDRNA2_/TRDRNA2_72867_c0_seq2:80-733(-)